MKIAFAMGNKEVTFYFILKYYLQFRGECCFWFLCLVTGCLRLGGV